MQTHSDATLKRYETTEDQHAPLKLNGMHITESDSMYHIDQDLYMGKIEQILFNAKLSRFISMRIKLACLENTIPDIGYEISQTVQATRAMYEMDKIKHCKGLNIAILICA